MLEAFIFYAGHASVLLWNKVHFFKLIDDCILISVLVFCHHVFPFIRICGARNYGIGECIMYVQPRH